MFDFCFVSADIPCVYRSDLKRKRYEVTRPINIGHDHNDSNIVYDWTGPVLTICSIVTLVEGDGALGPRVQGRRRRNAGIRGDSVARDLEDASENSKDLKL